ncbi:MAG: hypothetical protein AAGC54_00750 [Cyanobacteria bacterium P01_F01_bin.4]
MTETIVLNLPESLISQVREVAALKQQCLEDVLVEWIDQAVNELPIETLADEQILSLCNLTLETNQQERLDELLAKNREGQLGKAETQELDKLMQVYRRGLIRKAHAMKVAVDRNLIPVLSA